MATMEFMKVMELKKGTIFKALEAVFNKKFKPQPKISVTCKRKVRKKTFLISRHKI